MNNKIKICPNCWKEFIKKINVQKYCSIKCCSHYYGQKRWKKFKDGSFEWKTHEIKCKNCWCLFNSLNKNNKFCSRNCMYDNSKISRKWKKNPSYRNWYYSYKSMDKKEYSNIRKITIWFWEKKLIRIRKEIDNDQIEERWYYYCQHCFTSSSLRWETHHIIYRSEVPKHPELHNKRNLLKCCMSCHNEFHKDKKMRNKYIEERKLNELFWDGFIR